MNTSVKKCCICNNKKNGEFILINNEKYHLCCIEQLSQENKELKSQLKGTTHCYDEEEHKNLKRQLNYLRSGEYYNQLKFERDMLQNVVDNGEVSKEDKEFIDMTHRNTELLEQQKEFIKYLENESKEIYRDCGVRQNIYKKILKKYKEIIGDK